MDAFKIDKKFGFIILKTDIQRSAGHVELVNNFC